MEKEFDIHQFEKLFRLRCKIEDYQEFINIFQQSIQQIQNKIGEVNFEKQKIAEYADVPLDKELDFDFDRKTISWGADEGKL